MTKRDWRLDALYKYIAYEQKLIEFIPELDKLDEAHKLLMEGMARKHVAIRTGVGEMRLRRMWPDLHSDPNEHARYRTYPYPWPEKLAKIEAMLDDGASYREVMRTLHVDDGTLRKYFPGRGWTQQQAGQFSVLIQRMGKVLQ